MKCYWEWALRHYSAIAVLQCLLFLDLLGWPEVEALGLEQVMTSEIFSWKFFRNKNQQAKAIKNTTELKYAQGTTSLTNKLAPPPILKSKGQDTLKD